jgi:hypothetical protein
MNEQEDEVAHPGHGNNTSQATFSGQFGNSPWTPSNLNYWEIREETGSRHSITPILHRIILVRERDKHFDQASHLE